MWMVFYFWFIESVSIIDIGTTWVFSQSSDLQQLHKQYTKQQQKQKPRTQATIIIAIAKKTIWRYPYQQVAKNGYFN